MIKDLNFTDRKLNPIGPPPHPQRFTGAAATNQAGSRTRNLPLSKTTQRLPLLPGFPSPPPSPLDARRDAIKRSTQTASSASCFLSQLLLLKSGKLEHRGRIHTVAGFGTVDCRLDLIDCRRKRGERVMRVRSNAKSFEPEAKRGNCKHSISSSCCCCCVRCGCSCGTAGS